MSSKKLYWQLPDGGFIAINQVVSVKNVATNGYIWIYLEGQKNPYQLVIKDKKKRDKFVAELFEECGEFATHGRQREWDEDYPEVFRKA